VAKIGAREAILSVVLVEDETPGRSRAFSSRCSRIVNVRPRARLDKTDGNDVCAHLTRNLSRLVVEGDPSKGSPLERERVNPSGPRIRHAWIYETRLPWPIDLSIPPVGTRSSDPGSSRNASRKARYVALANWKLIRDKHLQCQQRLTLAHAFIAAFGLSQLFTRGIYLRSVMYDRETIACTLHSARNPRIPRCRYRS